MNIINNDDKESSQEKKIQGPEEPLEKEIVEIKPQEETKGVPLEEKPTPPAVTMPSSKEIAEIKHKIRRKPRLKRKPKPKPQLQISVPSKKWEEKWAEVDGKKVLFVPSGFEIMTKDGYGPVMMRADKIQR